MTATCRSCGAEVIWTVTAATGSRMPVDVQPTEDGNVVLAPDPKGPPIAYAAPVGALLIEEDDGTRYTSHFATCPHADTHRRTRHAQ